MLLLQSIGTFFHNNSATILGAFLPVLGSVLLFHYQNKVSEKSKYRIYLHRIEELIKYNVEIAQSRIIKNSSDIAFSQEELRSALSDMESTGIGRFKANFNDLFELVFLMKTDEKLLETIGEFYDNLEKTRKTTANFLELSKIVESNGVDHVYEFKMLRRLICLARSMKLTTTFDRYYELVQSVEPRCDFETALLYYIVELLEQNKNGQTNRIFYLEYMDSLGKLIEKGPSEFNEKPVEGVLGLAEVKEQFSHYEKIIEAYQKEDTWAKFLCEMGEDSVTVSSNGFAQVDQKLKEIFQKEERIYLSFLGICANGDALDNNGRSRQKENMEHPDKKQYKLQERGWYKETLKDAAEEVTITSPYVDTSMSYVVSFVKKLYENGEITGVIGLDVVVDDLMYNLSQPDDRKMVLFTMNGEIIFDTTDDRNTKKLFFNNVFMKESVSLVSLMRNNKNGSVPTGRFSKAYFGTVVEDKYYCLIY